ncbi:MAG: TadE/TadG family type IV pilus assembly protein [Albidovulum sp.]
MSVRIDHNGLSERIGSPSKRRFFRDEEGAALVEFAIALPMMLLIFGFIVEGSRLMLSFQSAISGVRDATRFLSRVVPSDICVSGGNLAGYSAQLVTIVGQSVGGSSVFPSFVSVNSVTPSLACVVGTYRMNPAPVAQVTANVTVNFPFSGVFSFFGGGLPAITTDVTDSSRVFGI